MSARKQRNLFDQIAKRGRKSTRPRGQFGGIYFKNYNPKEKRPIDSQKALHVVLKSSQARGERSFKHRRYEQKIWNLIESHAKRNGVKIYAYANAGNHLHLLIRAKREGYTKFIRSVTGLIARLVGNSERGRPLTNSNKNGHSSQRKFWDSRPFTRVVSFAKREYRVIKAYLLRNTLEAIGWMTYRERDKKLPREIRDWLMPPPLAG
jgi:REP element-mobilizing transposase RayT